MAYPKFAQTGQRPYCLTGEMPADMLTKALPKPQFEKLGIRTCDQGAPDGSAIRIVHVQSQLAVTQLCVVVQLPRPRHCT